MGSNIRTRDPGECESNNENEDTNLKGFVNQNGNLFVSVIQREIKFNLVQTHTDIYTQK